MERRILKCLVLLQLMVIVFSKKRRIVGSSFLLQLSSAQMMQSQKNKQCFCLVTRAFCFEIMIFRIYNFFTFQNCFRAYDFVLISHLLILFWIQSTHVYVCILCSIKKVLNSKFLPILHIFILCDLIKEKFEVFKWLIWTPYHRLKS